MNLGIAFAPLVGTDVLWAVLAAAGLFALLLLVSRSRGAAVRTLALALIVLALANPSFTREDREPLSSVAVVVVDKSPSQNFGDRVRQTEAAQAKILDRLHRISGLEVRVVDAPAFELGVGARVFDLARDGLLFVGNAGLVCRLSRVDRGDHVRSTRGFYTHAAD